ncbi:hypothetical protein V5799_014408 [Amblyomma americanum]|uniref:Peptidase C1A papain C-terminal domain-containing protein n=1 Tax=Amblyomma americanum TaxID=6943 RepID=A0AAQ4E348_AMBAM
MSKASHSIFHLPPATASQNMWKRVLVCAVFAAVVHSRRVHPSSLRPMSDGMVAFINRLNTTWKAGRNFNRNISPMFIRGLLGVHPDNRLHRLPVFRHKEIPEDMPKSFDAREKWPQCGSIGLIRDQSSCGSCWAFGAVEAISDRICIHSQGKIQVNISVQDLLACCGSCGRGCFGGFPSSAWQFYKDRGVVSGGLYGTEDGCQPYQYPPCEHHTVGPLPNCSSSTLPTPRCQHVCRKGHDTEYSKDKYQGSKVYSISSDETQIKTEIFTNGPVEADFDVYADFFCYKSGVYQRHSDDYTGGHAVKILGWGTEQGVPYWLAANSWNPNWGDEGFFKILRGTSECGIENDINAGIPRQQDLNDE